MIGITKTIGQKILLLIGIVSTVTLISMMVFYTKHEEKSILSQNEYASHNLLKSVISALRSVMLTGSAKIAQDFADRLKDVPDIIDFRILRADGSEAFRDNKTIDAVNERLTREAFQQRESEEAVQVLPVGHEILHLAVTSVNIQSYNEQEQDGEKRISFLAPIHNEQKCHLCHDASERIRGLVKLTSSLDGVNQAVADARNRALRIVVVSLFVLLSMVYLLIRKSVVEPLTEITSAMARVADGDMTRKVPLFHDLELKNMASSFNRMMSELLRTHKGFIQERNKLSTIILSAREGIVVTDQKGRVVLINPAAERLLGKTAQKLVNEGFLHLFNEPEHMQALLHDHSSETPEIIVFNDRMLSINAAVISNSEGEVIGSAAMIRDITQEKKLEESLRQLSYTDKLTGLYNRRRMEELLNQEFDRSRRYGYFLSIMLFDVDHFKKFNDTYGHDQGDRVLSALGGLLNEHFRKTDYPCRYGGEEFCVILTSTPASVVQNGAFIVADRFRKLVENMQVDGLKVTISIGVAVYPSARVTSADELIKEADNALYQAKHQGRNQVVLAMAD